MPRLAVVRADPRIPVRDLLLFDDFYVLNLDVHLDRMSGAELANLLYLVDEGVVHAAPSRWGQIGSPKVVMPYAAIKDGPLKQIIEFETTSGMRLQLEASNHRSRAATISIEIDDVPIPDEAARFVAAELSRTLGPDVACTFLLDSARSVWQELVGSTMAGLTVRVGTPDIPDVAVMKMGGDSSANYVGGVSARVHGILPSTIESADDPRIAVDGSSIYSVVLDAFPVPRPDTPLEDVLLFKREVLESRRLDRLGRWVQRLLLNEEVDPRVLRLDVADMLEAYEAEYTAQRMGIVHESVSFLLTIPLQFARSVLDPSDVADGALKLGRSKARLLQAEMSATGHELAYVASVRERFGR